MTFLISSTFVDSVAKLAAAEQKAVKTAAYDLQVNPAHPSLKMHRVEAARDKGFWSVRASRDLRLIVHRTDDAFVLCYAGHHDAAYSWAERRRLERHPTTGVAQLVEIRERVEEVVVPEYVEAKADESRPCSAYGDDELLDWGLPPDWLGDVRAANEEQLLRIAERLPADAAETLLDLATGVLPGRRSASHVGQTGFRNPEAQRTFRVIEASEELERALEYPWAKWTVFLHPSQRSIVEAVFNGPARVTGSAGTGKTIVALHRAVFLAKRHDTARVLLTTFSPELARLLEEKLRILVGNEPRLHERIEVSAMDTVAKRLWRAQGRERRVADANQIERALAEARDSVVENPSPHTSIRFLRAEWDRVLDARQIETFDDYEYAPRLGRKTRLPKSRRREVWRTCEAARAALRRNNLATIAEVYHTLACWYSGEGQSPWDHIIVDEAQDLSVPQLRFLAAVRGTARDGILFAGDTAQRIFREPFSWSSLGMEIRGRSRVLRVNYRTSQEIRVTIDRLLDDEIVDPEGLSERRDTTISLFRGPSPEVRLLRDMDEEIDVVSAWIRSKLEQGCPAEHIAVFVRSDRELDRAHQVLRMAGEVEFREQSGAKGGHAGVTVASMHEAKGLEFKVVAVMGCDDDVIPSLERIEQIGDEADLEEVYVTERNLLYVACSRAREALLITGVKPGSEFLEDME